MAANATAASTALVATGLADTAANRLVELANGATGDDFWRTHALDVVLYRFMKPISERITQSVRLQILERLQAFPQNDVPSWSIRAFARHGGGQRHAARDVLATCRWRAARRPLQAGLRVHGRECREAAVESRRRFLFIDGATAHGRFARHVLAVLQLQPRAGPVSARGCLQSAAALVSRRPAPVQRETFFADVRIGATDVRDINVHGLNHYLSHPAVNSVSSIRSSASKPCVRRM